MRRTLATRTATLCLAAILALSGCLSTNTGFEYLPERTHYRMFEKFLGAQVRPVRHVRETMWGVHVLGFQLRRPRVRETIAAALQDQNQYVSNLSIYTEASGTTVLVAIFGLMYLPRVTIEFDVVEVTPRPHGGESP